MMFLKTVGVGSSSGARHLMNKIDGEIRQDPGIGQLQIGKDRFKRFPTVQLT